jgi:hypothetical protein
MRSSAIAAIFAAGALLVGGLATSVYGGWFGLGGSDKSSDVNKLKTASASSQAKTAPAIGAKSTQSASSASKSTSKGLFGLGGTSTSSKPAPKKSGSKADPKKTNGKADPTKNGLYASKQKTPDKSSGSWFSSWMKPKQPPPPKTTSDWMKLKQVHY